MLKIGSFLENIIFEELFLSLSAAIVHYCNKEIPRTLIIINSILPLINSNESKGHAYSSNLTNYA